MAEEREEDGAGAGKAMNKPLMQPLALGQLNVRIIFV